MNVVKYVLGAIGVLVLIVALSFAMGVVDLGFTKFFKPKQQNIEREVFENTQSYVHGKTQDLAKYFEEYRNADQDSKESIRQLIIMNFSDFNAEQIRSSQLKNFLIQTRGY